MSSSQVMLESERTSELNSQEPIVDLMADEETNNNVVRQPYSSTPNTSTNHLRNPTPITPVSMASNYISPNHHQLTTTTNDTSQSPIRVPGTYPPEWLPDHETDACMACESPFTLIKRRHHCRSCGKIFCSDCCKQKARLLFLDNKEARVCNNCYNLIEFTLTQPHNVSTTTSSSSNRNETYDHHQHEVNNPSNDPEQPQASSSSSSNSQLINPATRPTTSTQTILKIQGVLKNTSNQASRLINENPNDPSNISNSSASSSSATPAADQPTQTHKQVIFSDGIRPGTDLSEPSPCPASSDALSPGDSPSNSSFSLLSRQTRAGGETSHQVANSTTTNQQQPKKSRGSRSHVSYITVCDEIGYLPPIVISKDSPIASSEYNDDTTSTITNSLTSLIINQFKSSRKSIQSSMESRNCPLNGIVKFEAISGLVGVNNVITFLLLKSFYLKVKIVQKNCCIDRQTNKLVSITGDGGNDIDLSSVQNSSLTLGGELTDDQEVAKQNQQHQDEDEASSPPEYWCFTSSGLDKLGQDEIMFVLDKDKNNSCIPRDIFKTYLTLHELALRRQAIENLGNLLFQDGLFGSRDTAGLLFVRPCADHCLKNLIVPDKKFLVALVLQRWEVPWSKVFPMRLLLRLGHKYETYPYPIVSYRSRDPVYYEVGHTIISILGDFRNFRYSLTHVDGLKVILDKTTRKVTVELHQSNYLQFSKVLDSSNNEHVLAWSSCPFPESDGHLVAVQNDEGNYETVEFYKKSSNQNISFKNLESGPTLGASFIVFSGALKLNQSGQPAKISIVEDGLLIQIQSCTMSALRNAVHYMDNFDIDCGKYSRSLLIAFNLPIVI